MCGQLTREEGTKGRAVAVLGDVTKHNIKLLRLLNETCLPTAPSDQFYSDALQAGEYVKLAWLQDVAVGCVCCQIEKQADGSKHVQIGSLCCLKPYRRLGIGSTLLDHVMRLIREESKAVKVYVYLPALAQEAHDFFTSQGFTMESEVENHFKTLDPPTAHIMSKDTCNEGKEAPANQSSA